MIGELMDQSGSDPVIWWDKEAMSSWIGSGSGWRLDWHKISVEIGRYERHWDLIDDEAVKLDSIRKRWTRSWLTSIGGGS